MAADPLSDAILAVSDRPSADSLFLRGVPTRKFPPFQYPPFPRDVLIRISSEVAMQAIFPFDFVKNNKSVVKTKDDLHEYIVKMAIDRELVIKQPLRIEVSTSPPITADLRLEYCFAVKFLERLQNSRYVDLGTLPFFTTFY